MKQAGVYTQVVHIKILTTFNCEILCHEYFRKEVPYNRTSLDYHNIKKAQNTSIFEHQTDDTDKWNGINETDQN